MGQVGTLTPEIGDNLEAPSSWSRPKPERRAVPSFTLRSSAFADGGVIPDRYAEANLVSPPLDWDAPPEGARSFALAMTDPDLPPELGFPRAFAHWLRRRHSFRRDADCRGRERNAGSATRGARVRERLRHVPYSRLRPRLWRPMAARTMRIAMSSRSTR